MSKPFTDVSHPPLFPPDVIEVRLLAGVVRSEDHLQIQLEVRSATDGQLLALQAAAHRPLSEAQALIAEYYLEFQEAVFDACGPF